MRYLIFYVLDNSSFIKKDNLAKLYDILYKNRLLSSNNLEQYKLLEENIVFNNRIYKLINMEKLIQLIQIIQPDIIKYNIIIRLINNVKCHNIYPKIKRVRDEILDEIKKIKEELKELKKIKNEIIDIRSIINYINTKINNIEYKSSNDIDTSNTDIESSNGSYESITYSFYFPNLG